jgi:site-specific DNA-methyltransferase (adenine-specific)
MNNINGFANSLINGDCIKVLKDLPNNSVDLVITDPPYLVNYRSQDGRSFNNENPKEADWLWPAFREIYRVLMPDSLCISFYGFTMLEKFILAWKEAGFKPAEQIIFKKEYFSSVGQVSRIHEGAYILAKGQPSSPYIFLPSVLRWGKYTGNKYHPTQKPVSIIKPLIEAFSKPGDIVLDPFSGSGTTALAASECGRKYIGIELDINYHILSLKRLKHLKL